MKLVVLTTSFPKNKNDYSGLFVLNYLKNTNINSIVIAPHTKGLKTNEKWENIEIIRVKYAPESLEKLFYLKGVPDNLKKTPILSLLAIPWMIKSSYIAYKKLEKDDILITNWAFPTGVIGALIKKILKDKIKHINIIHSAGLTILKNRNLKRITKFLYNNTDKIHFVNTEHISWFEKLIDKKIDRDKIILKPMPISLTVNPSNKENKNNILYLGRIVKIKGLELMLDELKSIKDMNITIAGDGYLKPALEEKYKYAKFTGFIFGEEKDNLLMKSNIMIIPSISQNGQIEGFPTVLLEGALSKNLLIISKEVKGIDYVFKDGQNCFYYNPYNKGELKKLIDSINEKKMEEMINLSYNDTLKVLESYKFDFLSSK
jgi:glycosyltransferase involved in cell wall biosynthesis